MAKRATLRLTLADLDPALGGTPASLSGAISISGTMQVGQTPVITWASVNEGSPSATAERSYEILETVNGGGTFAIYKTGATEIQFDALQPGDEGKQFLCRQRVHNAGTLRAEVPQVSLGLTAAVAPLAVAPPAFATGPTLSGTPANGSTLTISYTATGAAPISPAYRWYINDALVVGETAATWQGLGLSPGDALRGAAQLTGPGGQTEWVFTNTLTVASSAIAQTATFGALNAAGTGAWRPQLASGAVEDLASYDGLFSGSLGAFTPAISAVPHATPGRLIFSGGTGAPAGAVLNCTGVSGRSYRVTIAQVAATYAIASDADIAVAGSGVASNYGRTLLVRQNAQIPYRAFDVTGAGWLSASNSTHMATALVNPITVLGEGPHLDGEYHVYAWKSYFPSSTTIDGLRFANQKTHSSLVIVSSATRQSRAITVRNCSGFVPYNVDNADPEGESARWDLGGFNGTGYNKARFLYVTGGYTRDLWVYDNSVRGMYLQFEIAVNGALFFVGNSMKDAYFDNRKTALSPLTNGDVRVRIEGGNMHSLFRSYSIYETPATAPHVDADQVASGGYGTYGLFDEARVVYHLSNDPLQYRFHLDRPSTQLGGFRWSITGDAMIGRSPHVMTNGYPDNVYVRHSVIAPGPQYLDKLPVSDTNNTPYLGTAKAGDGGNVGTHEISFSYMRNATTLIALSGGTGPTTITEIGNLYYNGSGSSDFAARLYHWGVWASLPEDPTMAEAWEYITRPVVGSDFATISPYAHITIPTSGPLSGYTISEALRPTPVLSGLTVTDPATAAFEVTHDLDDNAVLFWSVFDDACSNAAQIAKGVREESGTYTGAVAFGIVEAARGTATFTGAAASALPSGTYRLCVAQYNGPQKTAVAVSPAFTVP